MYSLQLLKRHLQSDIRLQLLNKSKLIRIPALIDVILHYHSALSLINLLVLFVLSNGPEEVWIIFSVITGDAALSAVTNHNSSEMFGHSGNGLHGVGAGGAQHAHRGPEPCVVLGLDNVNEPLHNNVSLTLSIIDTQNQFVVGQNIFVCIDIFNSHLSNYN